MIRHFANFVAGAALLSGTSLLAQSMNQSDPTYRPAPMYSKSEKKKMAKFRMVHGIVKDQQDNPLNGALVNLKNIRTKQTLTYVTKPDGKYMFDELSRDDDYEISASFSGKTTPMKKISHYDPQQNSMRILSFADEDDQNVQTVKNKK
jgi:hypothetical protein